MRIAVVAEGSRGDVHPMLELARRLRVAGHAVRLLAAPDFADDAAACGLPFAAIGEPLRDLLVAHAGRLTRGTSRAAAEAIGTLGDRIAAQFACLPDATADSDLILGASLAFAAPSCAELHGIPYRYVAYCPALFPSAEHPSFLVASQSLPRWVNRLTWRISVPLLDAWLRRLLNRHRPALGLAPLANAWQHITTERPILAADRELAPLPDDLPVAVRQLPCLHPADIQPLPPKLEAFLEQGPTPVYVGFGSMPDPDPAATTRLVLEAAASVGMRLVIGTGWAGLGDVPMPEGAIAVGTVSHPALFARVAAVVHHGGAGTTTTAARAGVPQILVPHFGDQHYWARRVEVLGLGPGPIHRPRLSRDQLAEALDAVIGNELLAERAAALGERLRAEAALSDPVGFVLSA
jgi:UDP:flavonoid glycosyltransferase YjiC (YdhE family)